MAPIDTTTCSVGRRRSKSPTIATLAAATRSTKIRAASKAVAVPSKSDSAAAGSNHTVNIGGWTNALSW